MDVVIPVAPKDIEKAQYCLAGIAHNSLNPTRKIYLVAPEPFAVAVPAGVSMQWVFDREFPFSLEDIRGVMRRKGGVHENASWYYQQLLKLYAFRVIEDLSDDLLVLDSDFILTSRVRFLDQDRRSLLAYGYPFKWLLGTSDYPQQVDHVHARFATELVPGWRTMHAFSGMQHHMLFHRPILEDLFSAVEERWGRPFWEAFMHRVDVEKWNAASEYVLYHHFACQRHSDKVALRHFDAQDLIFDSEEREIPWSLLDGAGAQSRFGAIGLHGFLGLRERLSSMDYIPLSLKQEMLRARRLMFRMTLQAGRLQIEGI